VITDVERAEAEAHLDECTYCRKRYKFEQKLRQFVRQAVQQEPMPVELKTKLAGYVLRCNSAAKQRGHSPGPCAGPTIT